MNDRSSYEQYDYRPYDYYYDVERRPGGQLLRKLRSGRPKWNIILFVLTLGTTFITGWMMHGSWQGGLWYGVPIVTILLAHEMGHYLMCQKYGIRATLPYFIPSPFLGLNPFGTFGAVIKMESRIPSRKALFDVAVAGPLAGLVVTLPCIYFGVKWSPETSLSSLPSEGTITLGESILFAALSELARGSLPENHDILLHPLGFAGWTGLFVTALNLLPIGQLDGGHIVYALVGRVHDWVAKVALGAFAVVCVFIYQGWFFLLILLIWFGHRHPPTLDERPVDGRRMALGIFTLIIFLLSFTPEPFKL